jgi:hypothetical protein
LFAFASIFFIDYKPHSGYKRLTLLKVGALGMLGCNLAILAIWDSYMEVWYLSIVFLLFFEASVGPVMWLYISELTYPVNMGISTACNWAGVLMISLISYYHDDTFRRVIWGLYCLDCFMVRLTQIFILAKFMLVETHSVSNDEIARTLMPTQRRITSSLIS